jgi:hypothetical protein
MGTEYRLLNTREQILFLGGSKKTKGKAFIILWREMESETRDDTCFVEERDGRKGTIGSKRQVRDPNGDRTTASMLRERERERERERGRSSVSEMHARNRSTGQLWSRIQDRFCFYHCVML